MAVEHDAGSVAIARSNLGHQDRKAVVVVIVHLYVAGFEPTLDESCGCDEIVGLRGVVADQPLGEDPLVNHALETLGAAPDASIRRDHHRRRHSGALGDLEERLPTEFVALREPSALGVLAGLLERVLGLLQPRAELLDIERPGS